MPAHARRALPPLTSTLLELSQRHLSEPGGVRDMAGVLLGRLLTRPDCTAALEGFLAWAHIALQDHDSPRAVFTVPGICSLLLGSILNRSAATSCQHQQGV